MYSILRATSLSVLTVIQCFNCNPTVTNVSPPFQDSEYFAMLLAVLHCGCPGCWHVEKNKNKEKQQQQQQQTVLNVI